MTIDITAIQKEAREQVAKEDGEKAKKALIEKLRARSAAHKVLTNIDREIKDLEQSIADGSFAG